MPNTSVSFEEAVHSVEGCTECRHWVAPVLRDEYSALRDALRDIYEGYDKNDNALYDALNRHAEALGFDRSSSGE